ncbi:hypothetical protein EVAR_11782_1 [Eumeta japonica]|uniref:Uncharacterized protein n=1 Tax=Eumeta variegata TaxID=151549 RepID=A0A4C1UPC6_EUMVA|nr:hypothetical protein EVAR_11782_1 [Eumeta japonica]
MCLPEHVKPPVPDVVITLVTAVVGCARPALGQRGLRSVLTPSQTIYCIIGILRGLPRRRFGITGSGTLEHASSRAWYLLNPRCDTYRWAYRVSLDKPTNMLSD